MIAKATANDYPAIALVWELSVKATHHFLDEEYFQEIKRLLPGIFPHVPIYVWRADDGMISGFLGVESGKIEMLFIHPEHMGKGIGRRLLQFATRELRANKVDVNEQNANAVAFYRRCGFSVTGRSDVDGLGRPYPLLHMQLAEM